MDEILMFLNDNIDALTAVGIILTFAVSVISLYFSVKNNKAVHYVNTITSSRVEWISQLRDLASEYIKVCSVEHIMSVSNIKRDENFQEILRLNAKIKLMLNYNDNLDKKIIVTADCLKDEAFFLRNAICCIEEFGEEIGERTLNEQIATSPAFQELLIEYARMKGVKIQSRETYIGNASEVVDLFLSIFSEKEEVDEFIQYMFNRPEDLIYKIREDILLFIKYVQIYLKYEWNRVKCESRGKTYEKKTQEYDIWELEQRYDNPKYENNEWKRSCINKKAKSKRFFSSSGFSWFVFSVGMLELIIFLFWQFMK